VLGESGEVEEWLKILEEEKSRVGGGNKSEKGGERERR